MRSLLAWLGVSSLVGAGYAIGHTCAHDPQAAPWLVVTVAGAIAVLLALTAVSLVTALAWGGGRRWVVVGLLGAGLVRGTIVGASSPAAMPREATRGPPAALRQLTVTRPSWPGPRCRAQVSTPGGEHFVAALPASACPLTVGDRIAVPSAAYSVRPGRGGARTSVAVEGPVWLLSRADNVAAGLGLHAARARSEAWEGSRGNDGLAFVAASTLGLVVALPAEQKDRLRRSGLGHLIAISGLHVGLAAMLILRSLGRALAGFRWGARAAMLLTWAPVILYVALTGAGPPAVRAATMLLVMSVGELLGRPTHGLTTVAVAAALMLLYAPASAVDAGFQMSMIAMAVLVRTPPGAGLVSVSWRLSWAVMPIAWFHFGRVDGYGVFANVVAVPVFVGWVVPSALGGLVSSPILGPIAWAPCAAGAELILVVADQISAWPAAPAEVWVGAAALSLAYRWRWPRGPWVAALPPRLASLGMLAVFAARSIAQPSPHADGWQAFGAGPRPTIVVFENRGACVRDPRGAGSRWRRRVEEWGLTWVSFEASHGHFDAPELRAIRMALPSSLGRKPGACTFPAPWLVAAAVRACRHRGGTAVRQRTGGPLQCQVLARWSALALNSNVSPR